MRMEGAGSGLRCIIVRKRVLFPFPVAGLAVKTYVGMRRHPIVGQHPFVNALPYRSCDRLRCRRIDEKGSGLEDEYDAGTKVPAAAQAVGRRRAHHEHLATLKGKFP